MAKHSPTLLVHHCLIKLIVWENRSMQRACGNAEGSKRQMQRAHREVMFMQQAASYLVASCAELLKEDHGQRKGGIVHIWICTRAQE